MARTPRRRAPAPKAAKPRRPRTLGAPTKGRRPAKIFTSKPVSISVASAEHRFYRADLEISGIYHGEASYEGRVFFNNPQANQNTPRTRDNGYAGSFHIFGHGGCLGDPGHCEVNEHKRESYDFRPPHPLTPATKRVTVTEALRAVASKASEVVVTVVPVVKATNELCDDQNVFRCDNMRLITYNA
jgi:hypothetical protein